MWELSVEQHSHALAPSPELAQLCAPDNLSLDHLAGQGWDLVALVNLWTQESEINPVMPRASAGEHWGLKWGMLEVVEMYHCLQKNREPRRDTVCPQCLWLVPKVNNPMSCAGAIFNLPQSES